MKQANAVRRLRAAARYRGPFIKRSTNARYLWNHYYGPQYDYYKAIKALKNKYDAVSANIN